ncbi:hypothetical protein BH09BAC1_BH09BAC1_22300 [soil metagenome]
MKKLLLLWILSMAVGGVFAQQIKELKLKLNEEGNLYIKATFLNQTWLRFNQSNPGTLVNSKPADNTFDIGLRRTRLQLYGQILPRVFFYTQFGMNNFNYGSQNAGNRKLQAFFHDALAEFSVFKDKNYLKLGGGLTIANGLSRFSQPSIGSIMSLDVPVFAQATVDQTDEFSRKLSVFARGQIGHLDYRLVLSDPFPPQTNGTTPPAISKNATFAAQGHNLQYQTLLIWNFLESEPHTTPYMTGTYLGSKKILNLEAGAIFQPNATWSSNGIDTSYHSMVLWSVAGFLDMPVKDKGAAVNAYLGYFNTNYGPGYIRNNGIMNPANGTDGTTFNGAGNAYPMFGTGQVMYAQAGYKFKNELLGELGTLMPYATGQLALYDRLEDPVLVFDLGLNWFISGHTSKISIDYQNRPVFNTLTKPEVGSRASSVTLQYQIYF